MHWKNISTSEDLELIDAISNESPVIIFKHSTSCSISAMAKMRLESKYDLPYPAYYLDLLSYRNLSAAIAEKYKVYHESPQVLLIHNEECIYDASHFDISVDELKEALAYEQGE
ncbi:MAG: bacillithiol system redox-active protein YtxJ [Saprospiraceae bacterium]|nr:bacillithiol system redox-active protein YtxJ [Saprospiraceae bacterium]